MSAQAVQGSPTKANRIPTQSNLRAKCDHLNTDRAIAPKKMHGYIEEAKKLLEERAVKVHWRGNTSAWDAISLDPQVTHAHAVLLPILANNDESTHYAPTTQLLNRISLAVYKLLRQKERRDCARIFASNPRTVPPGDFAGTKFEPDYITYMGKLSDLESAVDTANHQCNVPWAEIDHVGEDKRPKNPDDGMAQLKSYMRTAKGYRPDLPTVHGFKVHDSQIMLALLNACDMWTTSPFSCSKLDPWIAYVVTLYSLSDTKYRNPDLRYNAQQLDFVRWDVLASAHRQEYALSPFYVARAPGRGTFGTFQITEGPTCTTTASEAFFTRQVKGFWKLSWQQTSARSKEKNLLQSLHSEAWLPGLVRLHENQDKYTPITVSASIKPADGASGANGDSTAAPGPIAADSTPASESKAAGPAPAPAPAPESKAADPTPVSQSGVNPTLVSQPKATQSTSSDRIQEILHLASIGEPLSQLESPRALIHAFYDLLETLIHMYERGVLHRDVSWFNVLYKGKHHTSEGKPVLERPCIEEIMHAVRSSKNPEPSTSQSAQKEFSPCILVTDLDHAIETNLLKENAKAGREKTGTPMFMAVELADFSALDYDEPKIRGLRSALEATNNIPDAALAVAFPRGDGNFMANFLAVMEEEARRVEQHRLTSQPAHEPRHDAESAFWVFFWAAVRALPRDASAEPPKVATNDFSVFCNTMLAHTVDEDVADQRGKILTSNIDRLFHPALQPFAGLFKTMACYFTVPWHYYEEQNKVEPDHAHVAFRRLLLQFELDLEKANPAMLDLKFNTEHPRAMARKEIDPERASALHASHLSHVGASGRESPLSGFPETGGSTSSKKRKANDSPADHSAGSSKKPATKKAAASETARFSAPGSDGHCADVPDYIAVAGATYDESIHFDKLTAHVLRLKFWKDRHLWFSRGE